MANDKRVDNFLFPSNKLPAATATATTTTTTVGVGYAFNVIYPRPNKTSLLTRFLCPYFSRGLLYCTVVTERLKGGELSVCCFPGSGKKAIGDICYHKRERKKKNWTEIPLSGHVDLNVLCCAVLYIILCGWVGGRFRIRVTELDGWVCEECCIYMKTIKERAESVRCLLPLLLLTTP